MNISGTKNELAKDLLGRNDFILEFDQLIKIERQLAPGSSLVLCLDATFGAGKTWFVHKYKEHLENLKDDAAPKVVIINAWELDYCAEPIVAIVEAISELFPEDKDKADILDKCDWFVSAIAASGREMLKNTIGLDLKAGEDSYGKRKAATRSRVLPATELMRTARESMRRLRASIQTHVEDFKRPIYVIIDELDRCRPDYAISYLETIKHLFTVEGVVFILAADRDQLSSAAKAVFGSELNFDEYFRKFVHRTVRLPEFTYFKHSDIEKALRGVVDIQLGELKERPAIACSHDVIEHMRQISLLLNPTMRQLHEAMRMTGYAFSTMRRQNVAVPVYPLIRCFFMALLRFKKRDLYEALGRGEPKFSEVADLVIPLDGVLPRNQKGGLELFVTLAEAFDLSLVGAPEALKNAITKFNPQDETVDACYSRINFASRRDHLNYRLIVRTLNECASVIYRW